MRDETQGNVGVDVEVVDESGAGQVEGSEGTPTHRERTQDANVRRAQPEPPPPEHDRRNAPDAA